MTKRIQRSCGHKETVWGTAAELEQLAKMQCSKCWADTKVVLYGVD